jgi:hypothetical protein
MRIVPVFVCLGVGFLERVDSILMRVDPNYRNNTEIVKLFPVMRRLLRC